MKNKKTQLNIRISEEAKNKIISNAKILGMNNTEYFETVAMDGIIEIVEINNAYLNRNIEKIINNLDIIGNNINQIARKLNSGRLNDPISETGLNNIISNFNFLYKMVSEHSERKVIFKNRED